MFKGLRNKRALLLGVGVIIIVGLVIGSVIFYRQYTSNSYKEDYQNAVTAGCDNANIEQLAATYEKISDANLKASTSALIAQCSSRSLENLEKSILWSERARDDYKNIGDNEAAQRFELYVIQFKPLLEASRNQTESQPEKTGDYTL